MPPPGGVSTIGVTAALTAVAPSTPTPPAGEPIWNGGISGYPFILIGGLVVTGKCPSPGRVRGKTWSRTAPHQSTSNRVASRCIILSG